MTTTERPTSPLLAKAGEIFAKKPFRHHRLFAGGHAQTLAAYAWPRPYRFSTLVDEDRLFEVEPGVKVLANCRWQKDKLERPTVVLWHGIEGSTKSVYMIATADKAFRAGFNVVRVNYRNCGGTERLTPTLYHGGLSSDVKAVIDELIERDRLPSIFPIGFSLGGNLILKFGAEYGEQYPPEVKAICAVSPSVNLRASADLIAQRSNWIYHQDFVRRLKQRIVVKQKLFPELYDLSKLPLVQTLKDFDEHYTAPAYGFADADDYYQKCSSIHVIEKIRLPTLIIHAKDDPFIPFAPLRNEKLAGNPNILLLETERGGHVAFVSSGKNGDEDRFWAENRVVEFCRLSAESA